jgi:hypothetical protein
MISEAGERRSCRGTVSVKVINERRDPNILVLAPKHRPPPQARDRRRFRDARTMTLDGRFASGIASPGA